MIKAPGAGIVLLLKSCLMKSASYYTTRSLEKVLGWSVQIISVRGEHGNQIGSRVMKINAKTYISFIAVDTDGVTISAKEVHE